VDASLMGISVLTIVRNRSAHLAQLVEGLRRSDRQPDELIIVDMSDEPVEVGAASFPVRIDRFETQGLPWRPPATGPHPWPGMRC
jgi:hypothetical protein